MSVYVDDAAHQYGRMVMCHMMADTPAELFEMVDRIGVDRRWYQGPGKASFPHFDICQTKRRMAVELGALEVGRREGYLFRKHMREEPQWWERWVV